jgi:hypothetical protein
MLRIAPWRGRLLADKVKYDLAVVGAYPMLEKVHALPGTEREAALDHGNRELHLCQSCLQVGGHIVEPFVVVLVGPILWSEPIEVGADIALYGGVGVLLDE